MEIHGYLILSTIYIQYNPFTSGCTSFGLFFMSPGRPISSISSQGRFWMTSYMLRTHATAVSGWGSAEFRMCFLLELANCLFQHLRARCCWCAVADGLVSCHDRKDRIDRSLDQSCWQEDWPACTINNMRRILRSSNMVIAGKSLNQIQMEVFHLRIVYRRISIGHFPWPVWWQVFTQKKTLPLEISEKSHTSTALTWKCDRRVCIFLQHDIFFSPVSQDYSHRNQASAEFHLTLR